jgi:thymidylate synthase (FAD)
MTDAIIRERRVLRSDFDVILVDRMGTDHRVVQAARTSTQGADALASGEGEGLTNSLMRERHGVPFEHCVMTFLITCPIFVWREFVKHRIGVSMSEQSARYMRLAPVFYVAPQDRPMQKVDGSKRMDYELELGTTDQWWREFDRDKDLFEHAYSAYEDSIDDGILPEKARTKLPVAIYSTAMITINARALMHFLSLRVRDDEGSKFPSKPQWEINRVADQMETIFAELFPIIHAKFVAHGRVCP